jgi:hypothetical protein
LSAFVVVVVAFIGEGGGLSFIVVGASDGGGGVGIHSQYVEKPSLIGYR